MALWAALFNHSVRVMPGSVTAGGQRGVLIENCHNGQYTQGFGPPSAWPGDHDYPWSQNDTAGYHLRNIPYRDSNDVRQPLPALCAPLATHSSLAQELICPFHMYRSSTDIRPVWGSILENLNTIPALADARLSGPGCWACEPLFSLPL